MLNKNDKASSRIFGCPSKKREGRAKASPLEVY
jgi:hypothetical protein